jgi:SAM-dependent methyltransferase
MEEKEDQLCKICGHSNKTTWYHAREMMFGMKDEFLYFQCTNCECLQIAEFPANISKYYPENYYSLTEYDGKKFSGLNGNLRRTIVKISIGKTGAFYNVLQQLFASSQFQVFNGLDINPGSRILDVGCGNGHKFLHPLAEMGFRSMLGCDPYIAKEITYPNGLRILKTDVFGMKGEWDVITYHHSFEHISNPQQNLQKVSELLSPKGICIIRIPTASSYAWQHYKTNWYQLDAPRHYFLHSIKSIRYLAEQSGLKLVKVNYDSTHRQFTESEKYIRGISLRTPRPKGFLQFIKRKIRKASYVRMARHLNEQGQGDQAAFYLSRAW